MGATDFHTTAKGKDAAAAYRAACDEAIRYYGHQDGYNGTISTTSGFRVVTRPKGRTMKKFLDEAMTSIIERDSFQGHRIEKWGNCLAIQDHKSKRTWHFIGWAAS